MKPPPSPGTVRRARKRAKLTHAAAASLVHLQARERWAEYENGTRTIDRARWDLFLILTGQYPHTHIINGMLVIPVTWPAGAPSRGVLEAPTQGEEEPALRTPRHPISGPS